MKTPSSDLGNGKSRLPDEQCVAICGLFCGACPAYPLQCHGCLSDFVRDVCRECEHGFRKCAKAHHVQRCSDCAQFPCPRLEEFSRGPVINGICNHANVIPDLQEIRRNGIGQWLEKQTLKFTCSKCGQRLTWFDRTSHECQNESDRQ